MKRLFLLLQLPALILAQNATSAQNATTFALLYGYPLLAWQRYAGAVVEDIGVNGFRHARELSTPENRTVVKPNVDTLYSTLIYDLSENNLVLRIPAVPEYDFKLISFYDPYGVNWANVGTGGFFRNGSYLLQSKRSGETGLRVTNGSDYVAELNAPSPYGTLLIRWGINSTNEDTVHQYQDSVTVREVEPTEDVFTLESTPSLESLIELYDNASTPAENVLALLAKYERNNMRLTQQLEAAGIQDGAYSPQSSVNTTLANSTALAQAVSAATNPSSIVILNQGWSVTSPNLIGIYNTDYALRTAIADSGYLALRNPFAVYPNWSNSSDDSNTTSASGSIDLGPGEAVIVTFSGRPPLQQAGFWSLTAYDEELFLIPNTISTYALGDRSNLTYPDGLPIYGPDADESQDGLYEILLQAADVAPPENWTSNWLPVPSGGGLVIPQLRFFMAEEGLINGTYEYPSLRRVAAITEGGSEGGGSNGTSSGSGGSGSTGTAAPSTTATGEGGGSSSTASPNGAAVCSVSLTSWFTVILAILLSYGVFS